MLLDYYEKQNKAGYLDVFSYLFLWFRTIYKIIYMQEMHRFDQELIHNLEEDVQGMFYTDTNKGWTSASMLV